MANRVSNDQLWGLLDFLAKHPAIAKGVGLGSRSKDAVDKQWNDLAHKLNSCGTGSTKSGDRWKKYWADLKHKSKCRLAKWRRDSLGTGGDLSNVDNLNDIDKKVLAILGEQALFGDSEHKIPVVYLKPKSQDGDIRLKSDDELHDSETGNLTSTSLSDNSDSDVSDRLSFEQTKKSSQSEVKSSGSRRRHQLRRNRSVPYKVNLKRLMDLKRNMDDAENKFANAAIVMAESLKVQAEVARQQAEVTRGLADVVRRQSDDISMLVRMLKGNNTDQNLPTSSQSHQLSNQHDNLRSTDSYQDL